MKLPNVSILQLVVLTELLSGECAGYNLRLRLEREGVRKSGPAFYQLMARLEESKWVEGWYQNKDIDGQVVRERRYRITGGGRPAVREFAAFARRVVPQLSVQF